VRISWCIVALLVLSGCATHPEQKSSDEPGGRPTDVTVPKNGNTILEENATVDVTTELYNDTHSLGVMGAEGGSFEMPEWGALVETHFVARSAHACHLSLGQDAPLAGPQGVLVTPAGEEIEFDIVGGRYADCELDGEIWSSSIWRDAEAGTYTFDFTGRSSGIEVDVVAIAHSVKICPPDLEQQYCSDLGWR
jgi:hypothetical protein